MLHRTEEKGRRLLLVVHSLTLEGAQRVVFQMACDLSAEFRVGICCLDSRGPLWDECASNGIECFCVEREPGWRLRNFLKISAIIRSFKPEIVHAHQYTPLFYSVVAKILSISKAKILFTEHGRHFPDIVRLRRKLANQLLRRLTAKSTAVSKATGASFRRNEWWSDAVEVIYNGIASRDHPPKRSDKSLLAELPIKASDKVVGFIGTLRAVKNPDFLLRVFDRITDTFPETHLVFIGDGPLRKELEQTAGAGVGKGRVHFLGYRNPIEPYYAAIDLLVVPSFSEGASLAILEAMDNGVPLVVTDRGGSPELVEHQVSGIVVPVNDDSALESAISGILNDPWLAERLSSSARQRVRERFSFEQMIDGYRRIYRQMLGANNA